MGWYVRCPLRWVGPRFCSDRCANQHCKAWNAHQGWKGSADGCGVSAKQVLVAVSSFNIRATLIRFEHKLVSRGVTQGRDLFQGSQPGYFLVMAIGQLRHVPASRGECHAE